MLSIVLWLPFLVEADKPTENTPKFKSGFPGTTGASKIFTFKKYEDYQISDGRDEHGQKTFKAGTALEDAEAVFEKPFQDKSAVSQMTQTDLNNLHAMAWPITLLIQTLLYK